MRYLAVDGGEGVFRGEKVRGLGGGAFAEREKFVEKRRLGFGSPCDTWRDVSFMMKDMTRMYKLEN